MNTETDRLTDDARQEASPGAPRSVALCIGAVMMFGSAALIFPRLGHYALWDDEANTALFAQAVWRTGDTTAVLDHNIIAYAGGIELKGLKNRTHPPLDTYVAAPFVGALGNTAFAARLPFALTGLATVMLLAWWLWRDRADTLLWVLTALGVLGNVSFMLYCRSARWYSLTMFLSVLVAYLYLHRNGRTRGVVAIAVTMMLLFAANYMSCLALAACLLVDYLIRGRKVRRLSGRQWLVVLLPQVVICGAIFYVWNPLVTASAYFHPAGPHPWWDMPCNALFFLGYYLRDMNVCEYGVGTLIALCPLVYFARRNPRLLYGPLALAVYVVVMAILSPGHRIANICEVRYAVALIPLCIFLSVLSLWSVGQILAKVLRRAAAAWLVLPVAALAFGTTIRRSNDFPALTAVIALAGWALTAIPWPTMAAPVEPHHHVMRSFFCRGIFLLPGGSTTAWTVTSFSLRICTWTIGRLASTHMEHLTLPSFGPAVTSTAPLLKTSVWRKGRPFLNGLGAIRTRTCPSRSGLPSLFN